MEWRTVCGADFLWRVPPHVLPTNFRQARIFGFSHPKGKRLIICGPVGSLRLDQLAVQVVASLRSHDPGFFIREAS